jgi:hypothetical protein
MPQPRSLSRATAEPLESRLLLAGEPVPLGPEFIVPSNPSGNEDVSVGTGHAVASDAAGNFVVLWQEEDWSVWFRRFGENGAPLAPSTRVAGPEPKSEAAAIAMNSRGDFVITWASVNPPPGVYAINARRYSPAGVPQGSDVRVAADNPLSPTEPRVAMDELGDFVVAWETYTGPLRFSVVARCFNAAGQALGPAFPVRQDPGGSPGSPEVAMDADGDFVVAWSDTVPAGAWAQRFDAAGHPVGTKFPLATPDVSYSARLAMDADGDFAAAMTYRHLGMSDIQVYLFERDATPRGMINATVDDRTGGLVIDMAPDGRFVVLWHRVDAPTNSVFGREFGPSGTPLGEEFAVTGTTSDALNSLVGVGIADDGGFAAAWKYIPPPFGESDVYARVFGAPAPPAARVVARHVFYNHSSFDENDVAANAADDDAIATDKNALLAGQDRLPGFDNVTSFSKGINGVMIDVAGLAPDQPLGAADFDFRSGPSLSALSSGPSVVQVSVRRGAGADGSDRVTVTWPDYIPGVLSIVPQAVANGWLQVTVKANEHTGLAGPDVFSYGNLIGEAGDGGGAAGWRVSALDVAAVKRALNTPTTVATPTDFNRDGRVNALDVALVKANLTRSLSATPAALAVPLPAAPDRKESDSFVVQLLG